MAIAEHIVASTRHRARILAEPDAGRWLWTHLSAAVAGLLSLVLMPDHVHLVARPGSLDTVRRVLAGFTAQFGVRFDLLPPQPAASVAIALRQIRYGFFNPVRDGLVQDPHEWIWSSLRDLAGATFPALISAVELAYILRQPPRHLLRALASTADSSSPPLGSVLPETAPLHGVFAAVGAALRQSPSSLSRDRTGRRVVVQTCDRLVDGPSPSRVAAQLGIAPRSVRRLRLPPHPGTDAALQCLADRRLRTLPRDFGPVPGPSRRV